MGNGWFSYAVLRLVCLERVLVESHRSSMQEGIPAKRNDTRVCVCVSLPSACGTERLHEERLVLLCCIATCVSSWCLRNPASTWGMVGRRAVLAQARAGVAQA